MAKRLSPVEWEGPWVWYSTMCQMQRRFWGVPALALVMYLYPHRKQAAVIAALGQ